MAMKLLSQIFFFISVIFSVYLFFILSRYPKYVDEDSELSFLEYIIKVYSQEGDKKISDLLKKDTNLKDKFDIEYGIDDLINSASAMKISNSKNKMRWMILRDGLLVKEYIKIYS